jgi:hypothetical protein
MEESTMDDSEKKLQIDLTKRIPWAIDRILNIEYSLILDSKYNILSLDLDPEHGNLSTDQMEKDLVDVLSPDQAYPLLCLKEKHSDEDLRFTFNRPFLASLVLCRTVIEAACEDSLRRKGHCEELDRIAKDKLLNLLLMARRHNLLDKARFEQADDIREMANRTVHSERMPGEIECGNAFLTTRGIIEHLYS